MTPVGFAVILGVATDLGENIMSTARRTVPPDFTVAALNICIVQFARALGER